MACFVVPVVVDASDIEEAERFLQNMLREGVHWDRPLPIPYIGEPCSIGPADRYATEEVHLLCDGMRVIAIPERGS